MQGTFSDFSILSLFKGMLGLECDLNHWSSFKEALWYCFGTLIGESITRDSYTLLAEAKALRQVYLLDERAYSSI